MKKLTIIIIALIVFNACNKKDEINQWRGDNRDGKYQEENLLKEWPKDGPEQLWITEDIGNGYGSPVITSDKIFVNGEKDSISHLFALDLEGNLLWESKYDSSWVVNFPGSRSTPTIVNDLVYVCSPKGEVVCFKTETGEKVWSTNMIKDYDGVITRFGFAQSLLVDGDKVFCAPGNKEMNVVAFNRFTGEKTWTSKANGEKPAFCSPLLVELPTRKLLVTYSEFSLFGLDTETGELLWSVEDSVADIKGNTPLYEDGFIYATSYGNGTIKLKLSEDGSEITEIWRNNGINNIQGSFIKIDDKLYGSAQQKLMMRVLDSNTGELVDSLDVKRGVTIYADGLLYYYAEQGGFMSLINPQPKPNVVSKFRITQGTKEHFAHPVIKNGIMYIRHGKALMAYNVKI